MKTIEQLTAELDALELSETERRDLDILAHVIARKAVEGDTASHSTIAEYKALNDRETAWYATYLARKTALEKQGSEQ